MSFNDLFTYDYNWMITVVLMATGFFYTILTSMFFNKEIKKGAIGIAVVIGYFTEEINVAIHTLYDHINPNPQVSTVMIMLISTLALSLMVAFKRFRTKERCMVVLTSWAIIVAWVFIHFCLVINQLSFLEKNLSNVKEKAMKEYVVKDDKQGFIDFCSEKGFDCLVTTSRYELILKTEGTSESEIANAFKTIAPLHTSQFEEGEVTYSVAKGKNLFFDSSAIAFNAMGSRHGVYMLHDRKDITQAYDGIKFYVYHWYGLVLCSWIAVCLWTVRKHRTIKKPTKQLSKLDEATQEEEKENAK